MSLEKSVELRVNFFDRVDSACLRFTNLMIANPLTYVGYITSYG